MARVLKVWTSRRGDDTVEEYALDTFDNVQSDGKERSVLVYDRNWKAKAGWFDVARFEVVSVRESE